MKLIVIISIILFCFTNPSQAEEPTNVNIINNANNPVAVSMDGANVTVDNDESNPVPVTMTDKGKRTPMSEFFTYRLEGAFPTIKDFEVVSVPEGKIFVLTDMLAFEHDGSQSRVTFSLLENDNLKYPKGTFIDFNLTTGIVFTAYSSVIIRLTYTADQLEVEYSEGSIFLSGYLANE
jgi:hypothetical protein